MKNKYYLFILLLSLPLPLAAQLVKFPLTYDPSRNTAPVPLNQPTAIHSRIAATEASVDTVSAYIYIRLTEGQNPVCNTLANTPQAFKFQANYINGGASPRFQWYIDGLAGAADTLSSLQTSLMVGQKVYCKLSTNLACAKNAVAVSPVFTITGADTLQATATVKVIGGHNPECSKLYPITFSGTIANAPGATLDNLQWFYNKTLSGTGPVFSLDSMANGDEIYFTSTFNNSCYGSDTVISEPLYRTVSTIVVPSLAMGLDSVTNATCAQQTFNFSATAENAGSSPVFLWYVNGGLVQSSTSNNFSTSLADNGNEVYVSLLPSLYCNSPKTVTSAAFQKADTLQLPFFDDFSTYLNQPDNNKWVVRGGTFINNTYPVKPPTYNAATFDGLQYNGIPYDTLSKTTKGVTDNLTSLPIDLSDTLANQNVYLSFFWQPQGLGEQPDSTQGDYLSLYFKTDNDEWVKMWTAGGTTVTGFKQTLIEVPHKAGSNFFHRGFQFKLETYGRKAGSYDVWNVDYVYLNKNRSASDTYFNDQSFDEQPSNLLNKYTAVPYWEFFGSNHSQLLNDSVATNLHNLAAGFNNIKYRMDLWLDQTTLLQPEGDSLSLSLTSNRQIYIDLNTYDLLSLPHERSELYTTFTLEGDRNNSDGKGIGYEQNNTIGSRTILDNFYAYDDGSAEYGIGINQKFGMVAYQFVQSATDSALKEVAFNFTKLGTVLSSDATFNLFVSGMLPTWGQINTTPYPAGIYYNENVIIKYPPTIGDYTRYQFPTPLLVPDTFYVGYQQVTDDIVTIGWDVNNDASKYMHYYTGAQWYNYDDSPGSLMIRPVFGNYNYNTTGVARPVSNNFVAQEPKAYPNPTKGIVNLNEKYDKVEVYNVIGLKMASFAPNETIDIGNLPEGVYLFKVINGKNYNIRRAVLVKD